jgi:hypothetical protein
VPLRCVTKNVREIHVHQASLSRPRGPRTFNRLAQNGCSRA